LEVQRGLRTPGVGVRSFQNGCTRPGTDPSEKRLNPMDPLVLVIAVVVFALAFDFLNGFNDAANSIATVVATRVLTPGQAVAWAAFFNFVSAFGFGTAVAKTIGGGMVDSSGVTQVVILSGLLGAIVWTWLASYLGLPISATHALMGGY